MENKSKNQRSKGHVDYCVQRRKQAKKKKQVKVTAQKYHAIEFDTTPRGQSTKKAFFKLLEEYKKSADLRRLAGLSQEKFIPYGLPEFDKGTQNPVFRLRMNPNAMNATGVTITSVFSFTADQYNNMSTLSAVFDEYRPLKFVIRLWSNMQYTPTANTIASRGWGMAVIDYDDSGILASNSAASSYDTCKSFTTYAFHQQGREPLQEWDVDLEPMPDQAWLTTASLTTPFAYWKPYIDAAFGSLPTLSNALILDGWADFQFRQTD